MNPDDIKEVKVSLHVSDPVAGQMFAGHYRIEEEIGSGGMGRVYRVNHVLMNKSFALKLIRPQRDLDKSDVQRFLNEARTLHDLQHENIVRIYEFGVSEDGNPYQILEFIDGQVLSADAQSISYEDKLEIAIQLATGLAHAHKAGVIHRDIKSSNILISRGQDGKPLARIIDFGIAKLETLDGATITKTGDVIGSPPYVSPEQALGQRIDARSDVYSLGVVLYELFSGKLPFEGDNPMAQIVARLNQPAPQQPLKGVVPNALQLVILHCLEMDRQRRYANADELLADLRRVQARTNVNIRKRDNRGALAIVAGMLLLSICAGVFLEMNKAVLQPAQPAQPTEPVKSVEPETAVDADRLSASYELDVRASRFFSAGQYQDALDLLRFGEQTAKRKLAEANTRDTRWFVAENSFLIAKCYAAMKKWDLAEPYMERSWTMFRKEFRKQNPWAADAKQTYIQILNGLGKTGEVERITKQSARFHD